MEKKYKYIDGVKYEVVPNYDLGSDVISAEGGGSDLPEYSAAEAGKVLSVDSEGTGLEWSEIQGGGGLTLYGPYVFQLDPATPVSVSPSSILSTQLPVIKDWSDNSYTLTGLSPDAVFLLQSFGIDKDLVIQTIVEPLFSNDEWSELMVTVRNLTETAVTISAVDDCYLQFYSTRQLPSAQP